MGKTLEDKVCNNKVKKIRIHKKLCTLFRDHRKMHFKYMPLSHKLYMCVEQSDNDQPYLLILRITSLFDIYPDQSKEDDKKKIYLVTYIHLLTRVYLCSE